MIDLEGAGADLRAALGQTVPSMSELETLVRRRRRRRCAAVAPIALAFAALLWAALPQGGQAKVVRVVGAPAGSTSSSGTASAPVDSAIPPGATVRPVNGPVLVSSDGRTITAKTTKACGLDPVLVTYPDANRVALALAVPPPPSGVVCSDVAEIVIIQAHLAVPLGNRLLVGKSDGSPIKYFDEKNLAQPSTIPTGFHISQDEPASALALGSAPIGDTRTYLGSAPSDALLTITQVLDSTPMKTMLAWPVTSQVTLHGQTAELRTESSSAGQVVARSLTWTEAGYTFVVTSFDHMVQQVPLSEADLINIANGVRLPTLPSLP